MRATILPVILLLNTSLFALEKVSLQLKWHHQFQFAGYYAAIEQGYYRDEGLDVTIKNRNPALNNERLGLDDYTVSVSDMLITKLLIAGLDEKDERDILTLLVDLESAARSPWNHRRPLPRRTLRLRLGSATTR